MRRQGLPLQFRRLIVHLFLVREGNVYPLKMDMEMLV